MTRGRPLRPGQAPAHLVVGAQDLDPGATVNADGGVVMSSGEVVATVADLNRIAASLGETAVQPPQDQ